MAQRRQITQAGINLIRKFEGFSSTRYICPAGVYTIGYGHAIRKGELWDSPTVTITEEEATALLIEDVKIAERAVSRLIAVPLSDSQFDAIVDFTFNLGGGALQRSTLRSMLNRGEYQNTSLEFPKWCWAGGRRVNGLLRRRIEEQKLFSEDIYDEE